VKTYADLSTASVAERLDQLEADLDEAVRELDRLGRDAADKARVAEKAYAEKFINTDGPMDVRRQKAILATVGERFDSRIADHLVTTQREALKRLHALVDMTRTKVANARKEAEMAQSGGRP
jgi:hypothetical protein